MRQFPIVSMALWLFALGTGGLFFWGSSYMAADMTTRSFNAEATQQQISASTPRPSPANALPSLTAIDFDPSRSVAVSAARTTPAVEEAAVSAPAMPRLVVNASALNLRARPDSKSQRLATLNSGEEVELVASEGQWSQVRSSGGVTGWAFSRYLSEH